MYVKHVICYDSFNFTVVLNDLLRDLSEDDVEVLDIQYSAYALDGATVFSAMIMCYMPDMDDREDSGGDFEEIDDE